MNLASGKTDSTYDFEFTREIKDALSIAPSRTAGGGGSLYSRSQPHTQLSVKSFNPRARAQVRGSGEFSVAASNSTSRLSDHNGKELRVVVLELQTLNSTSGS